MGINGTPASERVHIAFFGRRNAGKSSIINAVTGQNLAVVSEVKGTTTDPVYKTMELLPVGPVVMIDTPGIDDEGGLGDLRVKRSYQVLNKTDVAVLVVDAVEGVGEPEKKLIERFEAKELPYLIVYNKADLLLPSAQRGRTNDTASGTAHTADEIAGLKEAAFKPSSVPKLYASAVTGEGIHELKERIAAVARTEESNRRIVGDLISPGDVVVLVTPIDSAAPKGRLILPQQQTIRDILETGAIAMVTRETELKQTLLKLGAKPRLVITDSQAFAEVSRDTPEDIPLTSFSILFARYKGDLAQTLEGARAVEQLRDGDKILMAEGCTHHRQCDDIGTVKIPRWLREYTGKKLEFVPVSGTEFPDDLSPYRLIVHCGGCMLNEREMKYRLGCARDAGVPMTNYGILIASMKGILERSLKPLKIYL
ncbi:MAG: [FeFe] hydrogenase H-cluster maturation GTPase HydF [Clostridiales bacterium]|nr:[FeFe] hydrogenase H-cluster maturation GTPase HydF [Clostridiales bacterium]